MCGIKFLSKAENALHEFPSLQQTSHLQNLLGSGFAGWWQSTERIKIAQCL